MVPVLVEVDEVGEVVEVLLGVVSVADVVEVEKELDLLPEHALTVHYCGQSMIKRFSSSLLALHSPLGLLTGVEEAKNSACSSQK